MRAKTYFVAALWVLIAGSAAWACNTPVYRYAMYNWPAAPYRVFCLYQGSVPKEDQGVNRLLEEASRAPAPLNVTLETVDVSQKDRFGKLPEVVRKAWGQRPEKTTVLHAVFNTHGQKVFGGRLDQAAAKAMIQSPARRRLGELLQQGNAGVLVLLGGPKADRTRQAEQAIDDLLRRVQAGEIVGVTTDDAADNPAAGKPGRNAAEKGPSDDDRVRPDPRRLRVARMTVSRTDPAEAWFVRALLAVEDDLGQYAEEPMVFAVYGRARAMPPFVGKGITPDNLAEGVAFLAGACSCVIKDENPGVDLLVGWNWDATAEALAADEQDSAADALGYRETNAAPAQRKPSEKQGKSTLQAAEKKGAKPDRGPRAASPAVSRDATANAQPVAAADTAKPAIHALARDASQEAPTTFFFFCFRLPLRGILVVLALAAAVVFAAGLVWVWHSQAGNP